MFTIIWQIQIRLMANRIKKIIAFATTITLYATATVAADDGSFSFNTSSSSTAGASAASSAAGSATNAATSAASSAVSQTTGAASSSVNSAISNLGAGASTSGGVSSVFSSSSQISNAANIYSVGVQIDSLIGNTSNPVGSLKAIANQLGSSNSDSIIQSYEIYRAAMSGSGVTAELSASLGSTNASQLISQVSAIGNSGIGSIIGGSGLSGNINISSLTGGLGNMSGGLGNISGSISNIGGLGNSISGLGGSMGGLTGGIGNVTGNISGAFGSITTNLTGSLSGVTTSVTSSIGGITSSYTGALNGVAGSLTGSLSGLSSGVTGAISSLTGSVTGQIGNITGTISSALSSVTSLASGVISQLSGILSIGNMFSSVVGSLTSMLSGGISSILEKAVGSSAISGLSNSYGQIMGQYQQYSSYMTKYSNLVIQVQNGQFTQSQLSGVMSQAQGYLNSAQGAYSQMSSLAGGYNNQLSSITGKLTGAINNITSSITSQLSSVTGLATSAISNLATAISASMLLQQLQNKIMNGININMMNSIGQIDVGSFGQLAGQLGKNISFNVSTDFGNFSYQGLAQNAVTQATTGITSYRPQISMYLTPESGGGGAKSSGTGGGSGDVTGISSSGDPTQSSGDSDTGGSGDDATKTTSTGSNPSNGLIACDAPRGGTPDDRVLQTYHPNDCRELTRKLFLTRGASPTTSTPQQYQDNSNQNTTWGLMLAPKVDTKTSSLGNTSYSFVKPTGGAPTTWTDLVTRIGTISDDIIKSNSGNGIILKKASGNQQRKTYDANGKEKTEYHEVYKTDEDAVKDGACQMVAHPGGKYNITMLHDGTYKLNKTNTSSSSGSDSGDGSGSGSNGTISTSHVYKLGGANKSSSGGTGSSTAKQERGQAMDADVEAILEPSHPFSPRNHTDWIDRQSPSEGDPDISGIIDMGTSVNCQNATKDSYTDVCGCKAHYAAMNQKAWEKLTMEKSWDFGYYKIPLNKGGKILVDGTRNMAATVFYKACYNALEDEITPPLARDLCEDRMCKYFILPPVYPDNKLRQGYNFAGGGKTQGNSVTAGGTGGSGTGGTGGDAAGGQECSGNPTIYEQDRPGYPNPKGTSQNMPSKQGGNTPTNGAGTQSTNAQYNDEGFSYFYANAGDQFGYNMPPMVFWPNAVQGDDTNFPTQSLPADVAVSTKLTDKTEWCVFNTALVGVNKYAMPDGSDDAEEQTHNMSCQFGGWNELKLYAARCATWMHLNCICSYEKNFFKGTSLGYVLHRAGATFNVDNTIRMNDKTLKIPKTSGMSGFARDAFGTIRSNESNMMVVDRFLPSSRNGYSIVPVIGMPMGSKDDAPWPGKLEQTSGGSGSASSSGGTDANGMKQGLGWARKDDIIIYHGDSTQSKNAAMRPDMAAYVEEVLGGVDNDSAENTTHCLRISTMNNGVMRDACEITENWNQRTERIICPSGSGSGGGSGGSSSSNAAGAVLAGASPTANGKLSCIYPWMHNCIDEDWKYDTSKKSGWTVYQWKNDTRGFNSVTGAPASGGGGGGGGGNGGAI